MELILALFAWPLWALIGLALICIIDSALIHNNRLGWGSAVLVGGIAILGYAVTGVNPFIWAWNNFWNILLFIPVWLVIGGIWSIFKWYLFSIDNAKRLRKLGKTKRGRDTFWYNNAGRITGWIIHWPFSMFGFVFGDMFTRLAKKVWGFLSGIYASIEKKVYAGFDDDPHGY